MASNWKRINTEQLFKHPRLKVVEDVVVLPDGRQTKYLRFEGVLDYVTIIAIRKAHIAFVKDYSYPTDRWLWQLPEGSTDVGETPETTAARELKEEAGLAASTIECLGTNYGNHRRSTEVNYIFKASGITEVTAPAGDPEEQGMELHWFTLEEVKQMVRAGEIVQKNTLAALTCYLVSL